MKYSLLLALGLASAAQAADAPAVPRIEFVVPLAKQPHEGGAASRDVIWYDDDRNNPFFRLAVGDLDGNGLEDIVAARKKGGFGVWLQLSEGQFYLDRNAGTDFEARCYDIHVRDLNGDGYGDILALTADQGDAPGGIRVWLTRPRT